MKFGFGLAICLSALTLSSGTFSKALGFAELGGSFLPLAAAIPVLTVLSVLLLKKQAK